MSGRYLLNIKLARTHLILLFLPLSTLHLHLLPCLLHLGRCVDFGGVALVAVLNYGQVAPEVEETKAVEGERPD